MADIVLTGNTSGAITVAAPAVAGTNTLTLPANTGTVLTDTAPKTGNVLQVVQGNSTTFTSSSSSTYSDLGLSANITPSSTSSKILVLVNLIGVGKNTNNTKVSAKLVRGATDIDVFSTESAQNTFTSQLDIGSLNATVLDSPATTSSTTYKIQVASTANSTQIFINNISGSLVGSTITLMEIAG